MSSWPRDSVSQLPGLLTKGRRPGQCHRFDCFSSSCAEGKRMFSVYFSVGIVSFSTLLEDEIYFLNEFIKKCICSH